jgi:hypothetical protein
MALILSGTNGLSDVDGSASTPAIRGTDTNTGIFFPAADTIAFAEGGVEQMRLTSAGDLQMNSGYGSVATAYGCRAWVNFNGTGTVAIRSSGNVSSITDNGTGNYTINFTTAMPDGNYSVTGIARNDNNGGAGTVYLFSNIALSTTSFQVETGSVAGVLNRSDLPVVCLSVFR